MIVNLVIDAESTKQIKRLTQWNETHDVIKTIAHALNIYIQLFKYVMDHDAKVILRFPNGHESEVVIK